MLTKSDVNQDELLALIGQQLTYHGHHCKIIDLLDNEQLVLQIIDPTVSSIQSNQYGDGHRAVPQTYTLHLFNAEGSLNNELSVTGLPELLTQNSSDFG